MKTKCLWFIIVTWLAATATPALAADPNQGPIPIDPPTGRSQEVDVRWGDCCSSNVYELQVSEDPSFNYILLWMESYTPPDLVRPATSIPAGRLVDNKTYWMRIRTRAAATGETMRSPWGEPIKFSTQPGFQTNAPYFSPLALSPASGALEVPTGPCAFSWSAMVNVTQYGFQLAEDAAMTKILADERVPTTAYSYSPPLKPATSYYWRVRVTLPIVGEYSPTFSFRTQTPVAPAVKPTPEPVPPPATPLWVWVVIGIGMTLVIATLILTVLAKPVKKK